MAPSIEKLREIAFFARIPEYDLRQIAGIMVERSYGAGDVIVAERTEAERFFIVSHGKIEITKKFDTSEEFVLSVLSDGDFFGEMALLDERPRSATVRAVEPTVVLEISRADFETLLSSAPSLAYRIMKELASRLRETGALLISHLQQRNRQLYRSHIDTIATVMEAIENRDSQTSGRTRRVTAIAKSIGKEMGMADEDLLVLELSALLHDLGMLGMPDALIRKPGGLTETESAAIQEHPKKAAEMIERIPLLEKVAPDIAHHQEKFNGSGYPAGLSGQSIPMTSRIIAVADAIEAMTHERPYRPLLSLEEAMGELTRGAGDHFDPAIVEVIVRLWKSGNLPGAK
jgi:HD-GYP domain-containing protein (c-di-GMP phosphodiesterase class II)